ncbi:MAG: ACP S-malonyltransferase [Candidatus Omnitrophica bacterium]|nr:ACP S-malonyltransferase [Candidatus Omnitrophota bacterium]
MSSLAYLFPGQGAQAVGMGRAWYERSPEAKDLYHRANARLGFDLAALCFEGPADELAKTERCQLALFVTSLAAVESVRALAPELSPAAAAGLSLGELTALAAAGAFSFTDGLYLVQARAEAMAECAARHPGAMLAVVGLGRDAIEQVCRQTGALMANFNAPDQLVLSGSVSAIEQAEAALKGSAKRVVRLEVSGAFHSPMMQPAADALRRALERISISAPRVPVISNVTAQPVATPEEIRELLVKQLVSPVLWEPSVRRLVQQGIRACVEFPPARVLGALLRRIDPAVKTVLLNEPDDLPKLASVLAHSS